MDDRMIMDDILTSTKSISEIYLHGTIESATANVHTVFNQTLGDTLKMQNEIYTQMSQRGWYAAEQAEKKKIDQVKKKFVPQAAAAQTTGIAMKATAGRTPAKKSAVGKTQKSK